MLGGIGPTVMDHTSPFLVIFSLDPGFIQSPNRETSLAFGAFMRNVIRRSPCTSGETTAEGPCAQDATATVTANQIFRIVIVRPFYMAAFGQLNTETWTRHAFPFA